MFRPRATDPNLITLFIAKMANPKTDSLPAQLSVKPVIPSIAVANILTIPKVALLVAILVVNFE